MLLARLALDAGSVVASATLIDGLWGETPPADATNALQALVSRLRRALGGAAAVQAAGRGYRLDVPAADVDAHRFVALAARGREALAAGHAQDALDPLGSAAALWRGAAPADVLAAPFAPAAAARLEELRIAAAEDAAEARLGLGRYAEAVAELEEATAQHPLRERLLALRMRALHASGRRSDALAVYEDARHRLAEQLGVDPSPDLQAAHLAVLRGEPARTLPGTGRLPAQLTSFVGRDDELDRLSATLAAARLVTIVGPGGAGKTRLAVEVVRRHPAHRAGRAYFVALSGVGDPQAVPGAAVGAGGPQPAGQVPGAAVGAVGPQRAGQLGWPRPAPLDRLVELLGASDSVLVLDNCEHVVGAAAELAQRLLERLPSLTVLATSREPLRLTGEVLS